MEVDYPGSRYNPVLRNNNSNCGRIGVTGVPPNRPSNPQLSRMDMSNYVTTDMKYCDSVYRLKGLESTNTAWQDSDCILDPTYAIHSLKSVTVDSNVPNPKTLFAPQMMYPVQPEDNDNVQSSRIGSRVLLHSISVRGEVFRRQRTGVLLENLHDLMGGGIVRLALVMDRQSDFDQLVDPSRFSGASTAATVMADVISYDPPTGTASTTVWPSLYSPLGTLRDRFEILDQVFLDIDLGVPQLVSLPITLEPIMEVAGVDTVNTSHTEFALEGTVGLTAGTGGPIGLTGIAETAHTVNLTVGGSLNGAIVPTYFIKSCHRPFELNYVFKEPIVVNFEADPEREDTGTINSVADISFHIIGGVAEYPVEALLSYYCRCWFTDC